MSKSKINKDTYIPKRVKSLIGKRFNRWTVVSFNGLTNSSDAKWNCLCDCGNIGVVKSQVLKSGESKSCGCLQKEIASKNNTKDITNRKFGKLTAIKNTKKKKNGGYIWDCICDCGKKIEVTTGSLMSGNTKSCGCVGLEKISLLGKSKLLPDNGGARNSLYYKYSKGAKDRGYEFNLSMEEFREIIEQNCYYCGDEPTKIFTQYRCSSNIVYNGIDRVDNRIGYIKSNCVSCCQTCNTMKMALTKNEFFEHIKKINNRIANLSIIDGIKQ